MKGISLFIFLLNACAHEHRDENKVVNERLRQCYVESNSYTGRAGSVQGSMTARLEVDSESKVKSCTIVKNEFKDANLTACVCDILKRSKIGNPTGQTIELIRPVDFQAVEE